MKFKLEYKQLVNFEVETKEITFETLHQAKTEAHNLTASGVVLGFATVSLVMPSGKVTKVGVYGSQHAV